MDTDGRERTHDLALTSLAGDDGNDLSHGGKER
jgi:hypothetical protein